MQKEKGKLVYGIYTYNLSQAGSTTAIACYSAYQKNKCKKLQLIQNRAARIITGNELSEHITPILYYLHWISVRSRIM